MPQQIVIPVTTKTNDFHNDISDRTTSIMEKSIPIWFSLVLLTVLVFLFIGAVYSNVQLQ